jgi:hypothetical protein
VASLPKPAAVAALALVWGCAPSCPPSFLSADFKTDASLASDPSVHGQNPSAWSGQLSVHPVTANGKAWMDAVANASAALASFGVVMFVSPDATTLTLGLPFPLMKGQSLALTANRQDGVSSFQLLPAAGGPTVWLNPCAPSSQSSCALASSQSATGTLQVEESSPLRVRVDAMISDPADASAAPMVVGGVVTFQVFDEDCAPSHALSPPISG